MIPNQGGIGALGLEAGVQFYDGCLQLKLGELPVIAEQKKFSVSNLPCTLQAGCAEFQLSDVCCFTDQ